jgi:starch synthase
MAMGPMEYFGQSNFLKGGISFADKITTVSETYAREIMGSQGCGLEGVLRTRAKDVTGILNGVDYDIWSPSIDKLIRHRYNLSNLSGKRENKIELLAEAGLPLRTESPLVGVISRLIEQKGVKLIVNAAERIFEMDLQMIVLGSGDTRLEQELKLLESEYKDKLKIYLKFDESLAHRIEAGADVFLMPSLFEPCGLNQMYSLKYGTPPIVHKVGGLADTVVDYSPDTDSGTGFVFEEFTEAAMVSAIKRAVHLYSKRRKWTKLMKNGMKQDFSWNKSAAKYVALFNSNTKN